MVLNHHDAVDSYWEWSYPGVVRALEARDLGLQEAQKSWDELFLQMLEDLFFIRNDATTSLLEQSFQAYGERIGLLQRNQQLNSSDEVKINDIQSEFEGCEAMSVAVSFYELEFSFDRICLTEVIRGAVGQRY
ncbi:hypothetical protein KQX54_010184 [Cotesia glomerata]|uniref:Uncharacterized protein n=1 Tax=Cotesia glomerata TaxID=32391 RepID=A0AAV7I295_COTGL|nr:hypothetical protein KQX54_010184 [Cotesia glomerata]